MSQSDNRATAPNAKYRKAQYSKSRYQAYRAPAKVAPRRRAQPRTNTISKQLAVKIPECSTHYIQALFDPFSVSAGVCIPADVFPLPSQKVKVFNRGTINLGTTGFGFIGLAPTPWSDLQCITATTSTSVGNAATLFGAYTNLGSGSFSQLPYTNADRLANSVQARVVASGLRVRYAGTENNRQGLYVALEEQDHADTLAGLSFNTARTTPQAGTMRPSGDGSWDQTVCLSGPMSPQEFEFTTLQYPINNLTTGTAISPLVICMQGGAGDAIEYEAVIHIEYIGSKIPGKTASHADSVSYGKVIQAVKEVSAIKPVAPNVFKEGWNKFTSYLAESLPQIVSTGAQLIGGAITRNPNLLMGGAASAGQMLLTAGQPARVPRMTQRQQMVMA